MLKKQLAALLFACLSSMSFVVSAAEPAKVSTQAAEVNQTQVAEVVRVNLNTADMETLQGALIGIGKVKAQAIVDHRNANGPFASVDELLEVKGIGAVTLEKNRDRLSVN